MKAVKIVFQRVPKFDSKMEKLRENELF